MSSACPDGFTCMGGRCRVEGAGGECAAPGNVTLRQTTDDKVERSLVFSCTNSDGTTAASSWYRVFPIDAAGLEVTSVGVGICFAVGTPALDVKLASYGGGATDAELDLTKVTALRSANVPVEATQISNLIDVPIVASIPANTNLLVEISTPDLDGTGNQVTVGVTASSEAKAGYLRTPLCSVPDPVTTTAAGVPEAHFVITVTGTR